MVWIVPLFLVASAFCLALGLVLPLVRFEKLYFFSETPSLIGIAVEATAPSAGGRQDRAVARLLPILGKWSMMDVMLVALVIVAAKTSGMATAFTQPGLWFYAASAVMTGILQMRLRPH